LWRVSFETKLVSALWYEESDVEEEPVDDGADKAAKLSAMLIFDISL